MPTRRRVSRRVSRGKRKVSRRVSRKKRKVSRKVSRKKRKVSRKVSRKKRKVSRPRSKTKTVYVLGPYEPYKVKGSTVTKTDVCGGKGPYSCAASPMCTWVGRSDTGRCI